MVHGASERQRGLVPALRGLQSGNGHKGGKERRGGGTPEDFAETATARLLCFILCLFLQAFHCHAPPPSYKSLSGSNTEVRGRRESRVEVKPQGQANRVGTGIEVGVQRSRVWVTGTAAAELYGTKCPVWGSLR